MRDRGGDWNSKTAGGDDAPDDDVRKLMLAAGVRGELPADARARVYAATLATFEAMPEPAPPEQASGRFGRPRRFSVAAVCLIALGAALLLLQQIYDPISTPAPVVAKVIFSSGDAIVDNRRLVSGDVLPLNTEVGTGADGRLQLRFLSGVEMRVDGNARFQLTSNSEVRLLSGRIYFDTADGGTVRVHTAVGDITDIGTQFVVEYNQRQLDVIVREGAVQVEQDSNAEVARAQPGNGERLRFTEHGLSAREQMSTTDPYWHWIGTARAEFELGSGSLDDYLRSSAHECGLQLSYFDPGSQRAAQAARLHGTTANSGCIVAIDEVLLTTRLRRVSPDDGYKLVIDFDKGD